MNNYTKLLTDLANVDEIIKDKGKALILSSFPDNEYATFVLTFINGKSPLSYDEVSTTLMNYELRKKDKESSISTSVEVLIARERSSKRKDKEDRERSKSKTDNRNLRKDQSILQGERTLEKKLSKTEEKEPQSESNIPQENGIDSDYSIYSLFIILIYLDVSE